MRIRVTAIVVASNGLAWLGETLAALNAQTVKPYRILAVNNGSHGHADTTAADLQASGAERVMTSARKLSFGEAIDLTMSTASNLEGDEWLWLLSHDTAPEPDALERLLATVQRAPSVAVAGPKLVDWNEPDQILEIGQTITKYGKRWQLSHPELDQEQYDDKQDVMAVGPAGMLVKRQVWRELGGFDPALSAYDDGLDFSIRARLAGHRVVIAPDARVRFGGDGVAGPKISRRRSVMRHNYRLDRTAQLHRRLVYANGFTSFLFWLWLPVLGVLRMVWSLVREQPGRVGAEFVAAMAVFFGTGKVGRARRELRRTNTSGWGAIRQLRVDEKTVRTQRMIDREAILTRQGRAPKERHFIASGGLTVLLITTVLSLAIFWWLFGASFLGGGSLLPLSSDLATLWANTQPSGGLPADPFTWVLAVLGSITFWNPSIAVVLLVALAIPAASLAAWMWATEITESKLGRAVAAFVWALSPVLLVSISEGRLPTIIAALTLPWLLLSSTRASKSWGRSAATSLLAAVVLASAPSLIPVAVIFFVVALFTSGAGIGRLLLVPLAPAVLFAPLVWQAFISGSPLTVFIDPGVLAAFKPASTWGTLIGFPEAGLAGWPALLESLNIGALPTTVLVGILFVPVAALGLLGLYVTPIKKTLTGVLLAGGGLLTALLAPHMLFASVGSEPVALFTGSGILLYWLGLATLAASGVAALSKAAPVVSAVALVGVVAAVAPMIFAIAVNSTQVKVDEYRLPALVRASTVTQPNVGTIVLTAQPSDRAQDSVASTLDRGTGQTLDSLRTSRFAGPLRADELELAELTAQLVSTGETKVADKLAARGIEFVVVPAASHQDARLQLMGALDANPDLTSIGTTQSGDLWRVKSQVKAEPIAAAGMTWVEQLVWILQILVLIGVGLLALPTAEVVDRPTKRARMGSKKWREQHTPQELSAAELAADLGLDTPAELEELAHGEIEFESNLRGADASARPAGEESGEVNDGR